MCWYKDILTKIGKTLKKLMIFVMIGFVLFFLFIICIHLKYEYFEKPTLIKQCMQEGNSLDICKGRFD